MGTFLCIEEYAGGIGFDQTNGRWKSTIFNPVDRFVLKVTFHHLEEHEFWGERSFYSVQITPVGEDTPLTCYPTRQGAEYVEISTYGIGWCEAMLHTYKFGFSTMRYLSAYQQGFVEAEEYNENTPVMSGGTCTRF